VTAPVDGMDATQVSLGQLPVSRSVSCSHVDGRTTTQVLPASTNVFVDGIDATQVSLEQLPSSRYVLCSHVDGTTTTPKEPASTSAFCSSGMELVSRSLARVDELGLIVVITSRFRIFRSTWRVGAWLTA